MLNVSAQIHDMIQASIHVAIASALVGIVVLWIAALAFGLLYCFRAGARMNAAHHRAVIRCMPTYQARNQYREKHGLGRTVGMR